MSVIEETIVVPDALPEPVSELTTAETAECQCPDFCERDHDRD